jgi:hypothetical protein
LYATGTGTIIVVKRIIGSPRFKVNASKRAAGKVNIPYSRLTSFRGVFVNLRGSNPIPIRVRAYRAATYSPRIDA